MYLKDKNKYNAIGNINVILILYLLKNLSLYKIILKERIVNIIFDINTCLLY